MTKQIYLLQNNFSKKINAKNLINKKMNGKNVKPLLQNNFQGRFAKDKEIIKNEFK